MGRGHSLELATDQEFIKAQFGFGVSSQTNPLIPELPYWKGLWRYTCCGETVSVPETVGNQAQYIEARKTCPQCFDLSVYCSRVLPHRWKPAPIIRDGKLIDKREDAVGWDRSQISLLQDVIRFRNRKWKFDTPGIQLTTDMVEEYVGKHPDRLVSIETLQWDLEGKQALIKHINRVAVGEWVGIPTFDLLNEAHINLLVEYGLLKKFLTVVQVPMMNKVHSLCQNMDEVARRMENGGTALLGGY